MSPKLREDLGTAADVIAVLGLVVGIGLWIATWPGNVVPTALTVVGVGVWYCARASVGVLFALAFSTKWAVAAALVQALIWSAFLLWVLTLDATIRDELMSYYRVGGALTLAWLAWVGVPPACRFLRRRYGAWDQD